MLTTMKATSLVLALCAGQSLAAPGSQVMRVNDAAAASPGERIVSNHDADVRAPRVPLRDIAQMPGFPVTMNLNTYQNFSPSRGLAFADLDGDGALEIIASSTDAKIYAWDLTGALMPGFPVSTIGMAQYAPSVGDLDGDGDLEIVQPTRGQTSGGRLYAIDHQGNVLPGFPLSFSNENLSSCATLADLDDDGALEIICGVRDYPIGYIHIVEPDGTLWGGNWPVALDHVPAATASVGDLDDDGALEIVFLSYNSIFALEADGSDMPGFPIQIPNCNFSYQSPALADLDGDQDLEIVVGAHKDSAGCYVFHHDGSSYPGWPKLLGTWTYCPPTVTDLEGDGVLEIIDGRAGGFSGYSNCFWVWDHLGNTRPGFPYASSIGGGSEGPLTVADIDGDGVMEIFADYNVSDGTNGYLFGVDADGNDLPGFPLRPLG
ncbi:MAG: FG-GAP repeat domain-containing protein, partial [Phycisphaerales bacterium JB038]